MNRLTGKRILITAAAQGIGLETTRQFLAEGAEVWATDIQLEPLQQLAQHQGRLHVQHLDVCDAAAIRQLGEQLGAVDVLFNCAGVVHHGSVLDCTEEQWELAFDLNVRSMFRLVQACLPAMIANGGGSILNMSSVASSVKGLPHRFVYGASKAAVIGLTKSIAADFVGHGVRCNAICPGTVETPSLQERIAAQGGNVEDVRAAFVARQPMGRIGAAQEIAALAVYLASDESSYTTGAVFSIDGGMTI
jgi:2-keto-3-deoxy-L-fuconate dehydrogenase